MGGCAINVVLVLVAVVVLAVVSVARKAAKMIHFNANLDSTSSTDCSKERGVREGQGGRGETKLLQTHTHTCTCCKSAHEISALLIRVTAEEVVRQKKKKQKNETEMEMKKQAK